MQLHKSIITDCSSELSELDSELDWNWCLENSLDFGLPKRTPLCTAGCEGFLHLPPLPNQEQISQYDEPLLVLGIDLRALENTVETNTIGTKCACHYYKDILTCYSKKLEITTKIGIRKWRKSLETFSQMKHCINSYGKQRKQSTQDFSIRNY